MKIKIKQNLLEKNLDVVSISVDSINISIDLRSYLLEVKDGKLNIFGTDGEMSVKSSIESNSDNLEIFKEGTILVPYNIFKNLVKKTSEILEIEQKGNNLYIKNNEDIYSINLLDTENFPKIDFDNYGEKFNLSTNNFNEIMRNISFAASQNDSSSKMFQYINIIGIDKNIKFVATDGFRMATESTISDFENEFNFSVPVKSIKKILTLNLKDEMVFYIKEKRVNILVENHIIQLRLFDGLYKDISKIIPEDLPYLLRIEAKLLGNMISKATLVNSEKFNIIKLQIDKKELSIESFYESVGSSSVKTNNLEWNGEKSVTNFNFKFLKEAISVFNDNLAIFFDAKLEKALILSESNKRNKQLIAATRRN